MRRDVAVGAAKRRGVIPQCAGGGTTEAAVADAIRIGCGMRIQRSALQRERESGAEVYDAACLPAAESAPDQTLAVAEYRQLVNEVHHRVVGDVEAVALAVGAAVAPNLSGRSDVTSACAACLDIVPAAARHTR